MLRLQAGVSKRPRLVAPDSTTSETLETVVFGRSSGIGVLGLPTVEVYSQGPLGVIDNRYHVIICSLIVWVCL